MYQPVKQKKDRQSVVKNMLFLFLILLCGFTLISFNTGTNFIHNIPVAPQLKTVPFKGTILTRYQESGQPPLQTAHVSGIGVTTHLGRTMFEADVNIDFTGDPIMVNGIATFTAANGDQFHTIYSGPFVMNPDGTTTGDVDHVITSGTGRFAGISGSFSAIVVNNPATFTGRHTFEGEISY